MKLSYLIKLKMNSERTLKAIRDSETKMKWKNEYLNEIMQRENAKKAEVRLYQLTIFRETTS